MISGDLYTEREGGEKVEVQNDDNNNKIAPCMDCYTSAERAGAPLRVLPPQWLNLEQFLFL